MRETGEVHKIIDTFDALENLVEMIENDKIIGVDLEADSMYHFKEKVCLIQIAARAINVVIDPLMIQDLSPLKPLFKKTEIQRIKMNILLAMGVIYPIQGGCSEYTKILLILYKS